MHMTLPIMIGLGIMFIGMCVALNLLAGMKLTFDIMLLCFIYYDNDLQYIPKIIINILQLRKQISGVIFSVEFKP